VAGPVRALDWQVGRAQGVLAEVWALCEGVVARAIPAFDHLGRALADGLAGCLGFGAVAGRAASETDRALMRLHTRAVLLTNLTAAIGALDRALNWALRGGRAVFLALHAGSVGALVAFASWAVHFGLAHGDSSNTTAIRALDRRQSWADSVGRAVFEVHHTLARPALLERALALLLGRAQALRHTA
jgi:hypothetical protein